jgi:hypothetical protein
MWDGLHGTLTDDDAGGAHIYTPHQILEAGGVCASLPSTDTGAARMREPAGCPSLPHPDNPMRLPMSVHILLSLSLSLSLSLFVAFSFCFCFCVKNELTGEYTCIMLHALDREDRMAAMSRTWLVDFWKGAGWPRYDN